MLERPNVLRVNGPTSQATGEGSLEAGVLVVAIFTGPVRVVAGTALTVCGFAGAQAVLVGLVPNLVAADERDTAQGMLNFMNSLGGGSVRSLSRVCPASCRCRWPSPCSRRCTCQDSSSA
ncbi:hypothetical protein [Actinomadura gamaensis]|uniref:Uncharacterized protein n=1 Tax=Actinomadura gamaensis TaxID=1763541 RepID=A0ABV9TUY9_9ACTN